MSPPLQLSPLADAVPTALSLPFGAFCPHLANSVLPAGRFARKPPTFSEQAVDSHVFWSPIYLLFQSCSPHYTTAAGGQRRCPFHHCYPPQHSDQKAVLSKTEWAILLDGHCGAGCLLRQWAGVLAPCLPCCLPGVGDGGWNRGGGHHISSW